MKTADLIGPALDWAVAKLEFPASPINISSNGCVSPGYDSRYAFTPSTDWSQGGPIFEREISNHEKREGYFYCNKFVLGRVCWMYGPTLLVAAMRCYVASKLGDEIEIPAELMP